MREQIAFALCVARKHRNHVEASDASLNEIVLPPRSDNFAFRAFRKAARLPPGEPAATRITHLFPCHECNLLEAPMIVTTLYLVTPINLQSLTLSRGCPARKWLNHGNRQNRLGHSDARMTMRYTHVVSEDGRKIASKLGGLLTSPPPGMRPAGH
jgi:hypothetical protein